MPLINNNLSPEELVGWRDTLVTSLALQPRHTVYPHLLLTGRTVQEAILLTLRHEIGASSEQVFALVCVLLCERVWYDVLTREESLVAFTAPEKQLGLEQDCF